MYFVYDVKNKELCIGVFDFLQDVVDYLKIKNKNVLSSAISKGNKLKSRYLVKLYK